MTTRRTSNLGPTKPGFNVDRDDDTVMSGTMFALVAFVMFAILAFAAIRFGTASIESDIENRAIGLLAANDLASVNVLATGTEVELTGTIHETRSEEAIFAAVAELRGVTAVSGKLWPISTGTDEELVITGDSLRFEWKGSVITVPGDVSTTARIDAIVNALDDAWARVDIDDLAVLEGIADESPWLGKVLALILQTKESLAEGLAIVAPEQKLLVLSGIVETKAERTALNDLIKQTAAEIGFDANPAVRVPDTVIPTKEEVEELQVNLNELLDGKVVEFRVNSDEITEAGTELLDEILTTIALAPDIRIEIRGHADAQGSADENLELSKARAMSVLAYLIDKGQNEERFDVLWFGDTQPIGDNNTEEGRALNRRIEFRALLEEGGE